MSYLLELDGVALEAQIVARHPRLRVLLNGTAHEVGALRLGGAGGAFAFEVDGVPHQGFSCTVGDEVYVRLNGRTHVARWVRVQSREGGAAAQSEIRASMPGVVVALHCEAGQAVRAGDRLLTLESMKLQMTVVAPQDAHVAQVHVVPEAVFERGALLVSLAPSNSGES